MTNVADEVDFEQLWACAAPEDLRRTTDLARRALGATSASVVSGEDDPKTRWTSPAPSADFDLVSHDGPPPSARLGTPLLHSSGRKLGELRVAMRAPGNANEADVGILTDLATQLASQIELRHRLSKGVEAREAAEDLREKALSVANRIPGLVFERRKVDAGRATYTFFGSGKTELPAVRQMMESGAAGLSFVHRDDREAVRTAILRSNLEETDLDLTFRIKDFDRSVRWVRSQSVVRREADGSVCWDGLCFDITDLVAARDAAEAARGSKEALLQDISRDLRDPLQAVVGLAQLIKIEDQPDRVASHARNIQVAAESMIAAVDRLLEYPGESRPDEWAGRPAERETSRQSPVRTPMGASGPRAAEAEDPSTGTGVRILLADDLDLNRKLVADMLTFEGHRVDCVADGAEAVEAARRCVYDLILMDMIMPEMDGLAATRAIRALPPPLCKVPIIALTANAGGEHLDACLEAGMDAALAKPMSMDELAAVVTTWTRGRKAA